MSYHVQTTYSLLNGIHRRCLNKNFSLLVAPNSHKCKNAPMNICVKIVLKILHIHSLCACADCSVFVSTDIIYFIKKKMKGFYSSLKISVGK